MLAACSESPPANPDPDAMVMFPDAREGDPDGNPGDPDAGIGGSCDPVAQSGCSVSQKCSILPDADSLEPPRITCVPGGGSLQALDSCTPATPTQPDNCAPGLACRGDDDPRCLAFCDSAPLDTCQAEDICLFSEDLDGDLAGDVMFCARICDVLSQDCGQSGVSCYPTRDGTVCAPEGAGQVPATEGETCDFANACAQGHGCFRVGTSQDWLCFKICDADNSGGPTCAGNQFCNRNENDPWGVCIDF